MNIDLPTQYDPHAVEKPIYQKWLDSGAFHAVPETGAPETWKKNRFSIVIPPPNVTGALHLGHAINGTIQDILTRHHRMKGDNTLWMPGIDHAGIATQAVVERTIFENEKLSRHDLGREELVRRIWQWKDQYGARILDQQKQLGASCDWDRTRFTLDDQCAKAVREAFFKMFSDGLIFRGKRLVNWDTHLQTAVADDEIYHESVKGQMTSIRYPVAENDERGTMNDETPPLSSFDVHRSSFLIVATTRPETMLGDTALAVHPDDPRYQHLIGQHVIVPLIGRKIPIIADALLVDPTFGTGVVKVTPAHDPNDYATGLRHNLEQINLLTPDGKINEKGSGVFLGKHYSYVGLKFASEARKRILADLEELGLIADKKPHDHEVGHSDRSKTPIEPYLSDQWFVRMGDITADRSSRFSVPPGSSEGAASSSPGRKPGVTDAPTPSSPNGATLASGITLADGSRAPGLAQAAMDAVSSGKIKITPDRYAKGYLDWLAQKRDWCISRQLWWGHRIPVWHHMAATPDAVQWLRLNKEIVHVAETETGTYVCLRNPDALIEKRLDIFGFTQDPDVLDTWFSSALWPLSTMGWPNTPPIENQKSKIENPLNSPITNYQLPITNAPEPSLLPYFYPTSVLSTARDILTLWVARMVIFGLYCHGQIPFKDVYIHAVIQDGEGRTMSKSKGNGVDPVDIIHSHGADALRFTLASMATETQDIRMPVVKDPKTGTNTSPKFDIGRNFANKIWNASRFILTNIDEKSLSASVTQCLSASPTALEDRWILSRLNTAITTATASIDAFHFSELAQSLYQFFWTDLCDWYLEIAKARIKSGDKTVQSILLHCLETSLKLLHPVMPFITEEIWSKLPTRKNMLITSEWPTPTSFSSFTVHNSSFSDPAAESQLTIIQSLTTAIREIQNRYPAAKGKPIVIAPRDAEIQAIIEKSRSIIEPLAAVTIATNTIGAEKPADAASSILPEATVYIAGVIDKTAELAKLQKRREELLKLITNCEAKLNNESFTAKAPAAIVQGLRDQLAKLKEELSAIEKNIAELA